jgi:hypothetical protein
MGDLDVVHGLFTNQSFYVLSTCVQLLHFSSR